MQQLNQPKILSQVDKLDKKLYSFLKTLMIVMLSVVIVNYAQAASDLGQGFTKILQIIQQIKTFLYILGAALFVIGLLIAGYGIYTGDERTSAKVKVILVIGILVLIAPYLSNVIFGSDGSSTSI